MAHGKTLPKIDSAGDTALILLNCSSRAALGTRTGTHTMLHILTSIIASLSISGAHKLISPHVSTLAAHVNYIRIAPSKVTTFNKLIEPPHFGSAIITLFEQFQRAINSSEQIGTRWL